MATYAIGDIQGCMGALRRLLDHIKFDQAQDCLWFVGDLVNRGPKSLETLRYIKSLKENAIAVLGNHDLHLLAIAYVDNKCGRKDTLKEILDASDREELLNWLRQLPLIHSDKKIQLSMVHAAIHPSREPRRAVSPWDNSRLRGMSRRSEASAAPGSMRYR